MLVLTMLARLLANLALLNSSNRLGGKLKKRWLRNICRLWCRHSGWLNTLSSLDYRSNLNERSTGALISPGLRQLVPLGSPTSSRLVGERSHLADTTPRCYLNTGKCDKQNEPSYSVSSPDAQPSRFPSFVCNVTQPAAGTWGASQDAPGVVT